MKQYSFIFLLVFFTVSPLLAQDQKFSIDLNYPVLQGENFFSDTYKGWFDLNASYRIHQVSALKFGISARAAYYATNDEEELQAEIVAPAIFIETKLWHFQPYLGIEYFLMQYQEKNYSEYSNHMGDGPGLYVGTHFKLTKKIYLNFRYSSSRLRTINRLNTNYNRNIQSLNAGIGIML